MYIFGIAGHQQRDAGQVDQAAQPDVRPLCSDARMPRLPCAPPVHGGRPQVQGQPRQVRCALLPTHGSPPGVQDDRQAGTGGPEGHPAAVPDRPADRSAGAEQYAELCVPQ